MDRAVDERPTTTVLKTRVNEQIAPPFTIKPYSQRKKLLSPYPLAQEEEAAVRRSAESHPDNLKMSSPIDTRIPRPKQPAASRPRQELTLAESMRLADEEDAARAGSPSPAPRSWRASPGDNDERRMREILSQPPVEFNPRRRSGLSRDDTVSSIGSATSKRSDVSGSSGGSASRRTGRFGEDRLRMEEEQAGQGGIFSRVRRIGPKVAETGKELARKVSNGSMEGSSPQRGWRRSWGSRAKEDKDALRRFMSQPDATETQDAIRDGGGDTEDSSIDLPRPSTARAVDGTPQKNLAWGDETEFTPANLQVSDSPPVRLGRTNTLLDEIRAREEEVAEQFASDPPASRTQNTKLDDIRAAEEEARRKFPVDSVETSNDSSQALLAAERTETKSSMASAANRTSQASDDADRAKEIQKLSRKALASARLDELREQSRLRRSASPPTQQQLTGNGGDNSGPTTYGEDGVRLPNTPVTVFRQSRRNQEPPPNDESQAKAELVKRLKSSSDQSRNLLRRLARATSTSPAPETKSDKETDPPNSRGGGLRADKSSPDINPQDEKRLTVGFAGFSREPRDSRDVSAERNSDKRSSMAASEADPVDRIEAEAQLFAPMENHSEPGSVRAPSPTSSDDEKDDSNPVEETPRAVRVDPMTLPTPKVTGAYVETPAPIKSEPLAKDLSIHETQPAPKPGAKESLSSVIVSSFLRGRRASSSPRKASSTDDKPSQRASSAMTSRRSKSSSRTRTVRNSAKIPSVKDDLLDIHRAHQIDDSTLDDLGDLLNADSPLQIKEEQDSNRSEQLGIQPLLKEEVDDEQELERMKRMDKSLKSTLLGVRTAKHGIEQLEDVVSHAKPVPVQHADNLNPTSHDPSTCPHCTMGVPNNSVAYLHIPVPRLYQRYPFRFTLLGLLLFLISSWLLTETVTCAVYCRREYCYPGEPCDWSPDDPYFGSAIPVKLDQFVTGGKGRIWYNEVSTEVSDWLMDVEDVLLGRDIKKVDVNTLPGPEARRQHRRRLRKKGLLKEVTEAPEHRAKFAQWRAEHQERLRMHEARQAGLDIEEGVGRMEDDGVEHKWW
jgi:hypothetical protein